MIIILNRFMRRSMNEWTIIKTSLHRHSEPYPLKVDPPPWVSFDPIGLEFQNHRRFMYVQDPCTWVQCRCQLDYDFLLYIYLDRNGHSNSATMVWRSLKGAVVSSRTCLGTISFIQNSKISSIMKSWVKTATALPFIIQAYTSIQCLFVSAIIFCWAENATKPAVTVSPWS